MRGGFESVPRQQIEAAAAMNFTRWQTLRSVIIPQSWPVILPPAVAFMVAFIKDTSLVSQIGVFELAFRGKELVNQGYSAFFSYALIALSISPCPIPSPGSASGWRPVLHHLEVKDLHASYGRLRCWPASASRSQRARWWR